MKIIGLHRYPQQLLSAGFICSIVLLLFNDFSLKQHYPCWITGKLSDVAGLFAFPFFLAILFPQRKKLMYLLTAIGFILWKLPITDPLIEGWNKVMPYSIDRVKDYTDYLALAILPFSYYYRPKVFITTQYTQINKALSMSVLALASFAFMATAGGEGNIKIYKLNQTKAEVNEAMKQLYSQDPTLIVAESYHNYTRHYGVDDITDSTPQSGADWIRAANDTGVNFHFFFQEQNLIVWSGFVGFSDNWNMGNCELALIGYINPAIGRWKFDKELSREERKMILQLFERRVINKLNFSDQ